MFRSVLSIGRTTPNLQIIKRCFSDTVAVLDSMNSVRSEKSLNRVQLIGRLGRDAEMRGSEERSVVLLSVATNETYTKNTGEKLNHTDWHRVSVFLPYLRDNVAVNLKKGDRVYLGGKIRYDEYRDNENILRRSATILADDIINLTKKINEEQSDESE